MGKALGQTYAFGDSSRGRIHQSSPKLKTEEASPVFFPLHSNVKSASKEKQQQKLLGYT